MTPGVNRDGDSLKYPQDVPVNSTLIITTDRKLQGHPIK